MKFGNHKKREFCEMEHSDITTLERTAIPLICGEITRRKSPFFKDHRIYKKLVSRRNCK